MAGERGGMWRARGWAAAAAYTWVGRHAAANTAAQRRWGGMWRACARAPLCTPHTARAPARAQGVSKRRVGFISTGAPARQHTEIMSADGSKAIGEITSGAFSPCLKKNIAMGWVSFCFSVASMCLCPILTLRAPRTGALRAALTMKHAAPPVLASHPSLLVCKSAWPALSAAARCCCPTQVRGQGPGQGGHQGEAAGARQAQRRGDCEDAVRAGALLQGEVRRGTHQRGRVCVALCVQR